MNDRQDNYSALAIREGEYRTKKTIPLRVLVPAACAVGVITFGLFFPFLTPKGDRLTLELGDPVPEVLTDYFDGSDFALKRATLDTTGVDGTHCGTYKVQARFGMRRFRQTIEIVDTTPPVLTLDVGEAVMSGTTLQVRDLIDVCTDNDDDDAVLVTFADGTETLTLSEAGIFEDEVVATDPSGNEARAPFSITVDDAPYFIVLPDRYIAAGDKTADVAHYIVAYDTTDAEIKHEPDLYLDLSGVDFDTPGSYEVICTAVDRYGLEATASFTVYIVENEAVAKEKQDWRRDIS